MTGLDTMAVPKQSPDFCVLWGEFRSKWRLKDLWQSIMWAMS